MTKTFKFVSVLAAVFSNQLLTKAQQVLQDEQLSVEDALQVIPVEPQVAEQVVPILESDADIKLQEQPSEPAKKRKGYTVPLEPYVFQGENPMLNAARNERAQREQMQALNAEPKISSSGDKKFMNKIYDTIFGNKGASFDQQNFKLGESENTAPTDFLDQTINLNNLVNQVYTMPLYFGTAKTSLTMAVDTAYDYVVMKTTECVLYDWDEDIVTDTTCPGALYDTSTSDDYEDNDEVSPFTVKNQYTEVYVTGYAVTDTICLDETEEDLCVENFLWLDVRENVGIPAAFAGILGMPTQSSPIPQYLNNLATAGIFTENIFAIAFKGLGQTTFMDIGEVFDDNMSDSDEIVYFSTATARWQTTISGVQFGENDARQFILPTTPAFFDSNSALITVPVDQWETVIDQLVRELNYDQYDCDTETYTCTCVCDPDLFYDMYFFLDGQYWAQVLAEDFIVDLSLDQNGASCQIGISNSTTNTWTLGLPFLRGYYVVFDGTNSQTGIVPYSGSPKEELYTGTQPTQNLDLDEASSLATYGFIIAILVVLGFEIGGSYFGG